MSMCFPMEPATILEMQLYLFKKQGVAVGEMENVGHLLLQTSMLKAWDNVWFLLSQCPKCILQLWSKLVHLQ